MSGEIKHPKTFMQKAKDEPFVPLGILGTLGMVGYAVSHYKQRGNMSLSVYVMQYRVIAQSVIVGAMTLGVGYHMMKNYLYPEKKQD
ncbi:hypothetical protein HELRODRAFT_83602 [Helobdella robusta]|uniref:HIG1 domain-containing protein n=1 Tax=Helobdella robusta TaxID=6412 RepID=T1G581_HELRO|nr:hypothetical protein HELRODRAFT_83602 [Helobdella robusta]ESO00013.1 hypothetical protein HELRODRAFT_83602 [Helobdella robusta]